MAEKMKKLTMRGPDNKLYVMTPGASEELVSEQGAKIEALEETTTEQSGEIMQLKDSKIDDVQINGTSIKNGTVANIPLASTTQAGVIKAGIGVVVDANGALYTTPAQYVDLNNRKAEDGYGKSSNKRNIIAPATIDYAVKCAMGDGKGAEWEESFKQKARERLGVAIVTLTQAEYDALEIKSADTTYLVTESD